MMGLAIVLVVATVALIAAALWTIRTLMQRNDQMARALEDPDTETLDYAVPEGQDPSILLAVLERAGYVVSEDVHPTAPPS